MVSVCSRSSRVTALENGNRPATPSPIIAGVLGIARTRRVCPFSHLERLARRTPAAMLMTRLALSAIPDLAAASRRCWGFTANTTTSFARTASLGLSKQVTPYLSTSLRRASALISTTRISCSGKSLRRSPPISASAMLPPPMNVILMSKIRGSRLSFSKNRGAHAHHGGALGDCRLEVRRHAHRERIHRQAVAVHPVAQLAQLRKTPPLQGGVRGRLGHRHEPPKLQAREPCHLLRKLSGFLRRDTALRRLARHVDLDADLQRGAPRGARLCEPRGSFRRPPARSFRRNRAIPRAPPRARPAAETFCSPRAIAPIGRACPPPGSRIRCAASRLASSRVLRT